MTRRLVELVQKMIDAVDQAKLSTVQSESWHPVLALIDNGTRGRPGPIRGLAQELREELIEVAHQERMRELRGERP